jgi:probable HAF family extracellular repeat protein
VETAFFKLMTFVCTLGVGLITQAWGLTYTYSDIQVPGSISTSPKGINNKGEVVGYYQNSSGVYGFVLSNGNYTTINCSAATQGTFAFGINDDGVIVGYYSTPFKNYGFVYANGKCKNLSDFSGSVPYAAGINNAGQIVGSYISKNLSHGFELRGTAYSEISVPNSSQTFAYGINANGDVSGSYYDANGAHHGFLLHDGTYQTIDAPNSGATTCGVGLNDKDLVVGFYEDQSLQSYEGFVTNTKEFVELIVPGSVTTFAAAINDRNVVVGYYFNGTVNPQGFMATPSGE